MLLKKLDRLLSTITKDMSERDFSNTERIIEQLETIIDNSEMLIKN